MADVLIATRNAGKVLEIRALAEERRNRVRPADLVAWRGLDEYPQVEEPDETAPTFSGNATLKALYYGRQTGLATLADDSGLEVEALGGAPGVNSAYFAGKPRDDVANNRKLISMLKDVPATRRAAAFRCVMVFVLDGRVVHETQGRVTGLIIDEPRGDGGFGYDPHFLIPELGRTMAQLKPAEKNLVSHRGRALRAMLPLIEAYYAARRAQ